MGGSQDATSAEQTTSSGASATEMWMLLIVRMISRVAMPPLDDDEDTDKYANKEQTEDEALEFDFYARQDK